MTGIHSVMAARRRLACICLLSLIAMSTGVRAQTLDQMYEFYLEQVAVPCERLAFQRDAELTILPGQAGPNLFSFCSGPPRVTGPGGTSNSTGGSAGATESRGPGAEEDAALRRRRERVRKGESERASPDASDYSLAEIGKTSVFLSLDYRHERQRSTHFEDGQRSHEWGATLGMDHRFGTTGVAGLAYKYNRQSGDFETGGGFDSHSNGAWLYGSWFPHENMFIDFTAGVDFKNLDTTRIVARRIVTVFFTGATVVAFNPPPTPVRSDADSREPGAEIRAGYDWVLAGAVIGPRAGVIARHMELDAFSERGATPMALAFDAQTETSLRSSLGIQGSRAFSNSMGVIVPQLNLDWLHEYRDDQRTITAHFAEDLRASPVQLRFQNEPPDRDFFIARLSTVAALAHGFSAFLSVQSTFGHAYIDRYAASAGLRMEL